MPDTRETLRALVSAFNVNNYDFNAVKTNFTLQSRYGKDCIVVLFDKGMKDYQCSEYLYNIKRKIVGEFYGIEEGDTDEVVLNTAKLIFDVKSFPFNDYKGEWSGDEHHGFKFVTPVDQGVIFNLKSHLASSLVKDVLEDMPTCSIVTNSFNKRKYLCHSKFPNKQLSKEFEREFLSRMRERYENVPKNPLKIEGNSVYIKDVFDDARFVDSVTRRAAWRIGIDLGVSNDVDHSVMLLKDSIISSFYQSTKTIVAGFMCASPLNREEASILIPIVQDCRGARFLIAKEAGDINHKFSNLVLDDVSDKVQAEISVNGSNVVYGIDFSNKEISHCVITKIIESSVINKDHELAIDPERALSPAQSPFNSPIHAGPSGLETPPNPRKRDRDSGIGESPLKLEDFGVQSQVGMPSGPSSGLTELSSPVQGFPTRSQGEELGGSPRQGSEKEELLFNHVNSDGPSKGFSPRSHLNFTTVNYGVSGPSSSVQSVSAAQNVPAGASTWDQPIGAWSSPAPSAEPSLWQPSRPSSWKGANPVGTNPWAQQTNRWSLPASSAGLWSLPQSGPSSWKGASESGSAWTSQPIDSWSSPASSAELRQQSQVSSSGPSSSRGANESMRTGKSIWYVPSSYSPGVEDVNDVEPEKQQVSDECSEAKSQKSESPKEHGGIFQKIKDLCSSPSKSKQRDAGLKRHNVGRDTTRSMPTISVTKKTLLSERSASERKAKSNPPSKVTSPTHEGAPGGLKPLTSDERKELRPFLSPELQKKLDSNSFSPGEEQHLYLTHTLSGKRELSRSLCEGKESQLLRLTKAQLPDNSSSKRDSGYSSGLPASPAVPHKESVSSEVKECRTVEHTRETWGKRI